MHPLDKLNIEEIMIPPDQGNYTFHFEFPMAQGRTTYFVPCKKPDPIKFSVPLNRSIMKLEDWLTRKDLDKDFCGVDRSKDAWRLAGGVYENKHQSLDDMWAFMRREGARIDAILEGENCWYFLQTNTWKWIYRMGRATALICTMPGFNGIHYYGK